MKYIVTIFFLFSFFCGKIILFNVVFDLNEQFEIKNCFELKRSTFGEKKKVAEKVRISWSIKSGVIRRGIILKSRKISRRLQLSGAHKSFATKWEFIVEEKLLIPIGFRAYTTKKMAWACLFFFFSFLSFSIYFLFLLRIVNFKVPTCHYLTA